MLFAPMKEWEIGWTKEKQNKLERSLTSFA